MINFRESQVRWTPSLWFQLDVMESASLPWKKSLVYQIYRIFKNQFGQHPVLGIRKDAPAWEREGKGDTTASAIPNSDGLPERDRRGWDKTLENVWDLLHFSSFNAAEKKHIRVPL